MSSSSSNVDPPQEKISAEWDAMAGEWDDLASSYRDSFCLILEKDLLNSSKYDMSSLVVLDFGCGTGLLTEWLQPRVGRVICIDAAKMMVQQCQQKIRGSEWKNVEAHCCALANVQDADTQAILAQLESKVDVIVASSVLSFIPSEDLKVTMQKLGRILKPNGILCHSDWPKGEESADGFTEEYAKEVYEMAGLQSESIKVVPFTFEDEEGQVFIGIAKKTP